MFRQIRWKIWAVILAAVAVLGLVYYYGVIRDEVPSEPPVYSVILYQHTDNEWAVLMDGLEQAEEDLNVNVNYITMGENDTAADQADRIRREIEAGSSGILAAAVDSEGLYRELEGTEINVPVICVETGAGERFPTISADDYQMGRTLGEQILKDMEADGGEPEVTVIAEYMERDSVRKRYEGLLDALQSSPRKVNVREISRSAGDYSLRLFIGTMLSGSGMYIAALDKFSTEEAAAAWASNRQIFAASGISFFVYGIGNTGQTVNDLDNENLRMLVYQNEFNIGYEGLSALVKDRSEEWIAKNVNIKFMTATKSTLYDYENERLLFPNV